MADTLVLIPAYNEAAHIAAVIGAVRSVLAEADVVVVDDGSRDGTAELAREAGAAVVVLPFNMGYGVAIQTGYKYALARGYRYLVQIDADGQHDPAFLPTLLAPVRSGEADFVLGSRFLQAESYTPSLGRRLGMGFFRALVSALIGQRITDSTSGYQAFNRQVMAFFATEIFPCDYPDADVLLWLHRAGFAIREIPVRMYANPASKSMHSGLKPLYYVFKMLLSIGVTLLRSRPPHRGGRPCS